MIAADVVSVSVDGLPALRTSLLPRRRPAIAGHGVFLGLTLLVPPVSTRHGVSSREASRGVPPRSVHAARGGTNARSSFKIRSGARNGARCPRPVRGTYA